MRLRHTTIILPTCAAFHSHETRVSAVIFMRSASPRPDNLRSGCAVLSEGNAIVSGADAVIAPRRTVGGQAFMSFMFEKLEVYQKAVDLAGRIETLSKGITGQGYHHLLDQLQRARLFPFR